MPEEKEKTWVDLHYAFIAVLTQEIEYQISKYCRFILSAGAAEERKIHSMIFFFI